MEPNRPIRFRGKRIDNGQWVYGYYTVYQKNWLCIPDAHYIHNEHRYTVDPATVGQFTGIQDKNGSDIYFDSDIIKCPDYEWDEIAGAGYYSRKTDLIFTLNYSIFGTEVKLINPPEGLTTVSLSVLLNRNNSYYHLNYPARFEIIGNALLNPAK